jgi:hypothetical protein
VETLVFKVQLDYQVILVLLARSEQQVLLVLLVLLEERVIPDLLDLLAVQDNRVQMVLQGHLVLLAILVHLDRPEQEGQLDRRVTLVRQDPMVNQDQKVLLDQQAKLVSQVFREPAEAVALQDRWVALDNLDKTVLVVTREAPVLLA